MSIESTVLRSHEPGFSFPRNCAIHDRKKEGRKCGPQFVFRNPEEDTVGAYLERLEAEGTWKAYIKRILLQGYLVLTQLLIAGGALGLPVTLITWLIGRTPWWYVPLCLGGTCFGWFAQLLLPFA